MEEVRLVTHRGGCFCKAVRFEFDGPADVVAWDCNCSMCTMKRITHLIVPGHRFRLLQGQDQLTLYQFGTLTAKHLFCKTCGIHSFYVPRSNPDGFDVNLHCVDAGTIASVTVHPFDGQNWEAAHATSDIAAASQQ